jgi:hypothetical protein
MNPQELAGVHLYVEGIVSFRAQNSYVMLENPENNLADARIRI